MMTATIMLLLTLHKGILSNTYLLITQTMIYTTFMTVSKHDTNCDIIMYYELLEILTIQIHKSSVREKEAHSSKKDMSIDCALFLCEDSI